MFYCQYCFSVIFICFSGVWFAKEGQLLEINFQVETQQTDNIVAVQVLRPSCSSGQVVVRPGKNLNGRLHTQVQI